MVYFGQGSVNLLLVVACRSVALNFLGIDHAGWVTLAFYLVLVIVSVQVWGFGLRLRNPRPWERHIVYPLCLPLGPMGVVAGHAWLPCV